MNVANLQLEGLIMAVASINHLLVRKGLLTVEEIETVLRQVQANMTGEERSEDLSLASRDAINFPLRALQICNRCASAGELPLFSKVARLVGEMKPSYNDQQ